MEYRREIDGLRAIAVTGVVLCHASVFGLDGGFVGVDVFFVISGYLITRILQEEHTRTGRISLVNFYERRVRRLLPAFYIMLTSVSVVVTFLYVPGDLVRFSESALSALMLASNFYFWKTSGYFADESEVAPLLHTWSLAVEEQFYLLWPLVLFVCLPRAGLSRRLKSLGALAALLSLAAAQFGAVNFPQPAFYMMPTRAFELLIGALLAQPQFPVLRSRERCEVLTLAGLCAIAASFLLLDGNVRFPGFVALIPCVGTALVLFAGSKSHCAQFLLANRSIVFVGVVSYSWYLFHWPAFAIWRYVTFRDPGMAEALILLTASFACAVLSWRYIERPFRRQVPDAVVLRSGLRTIMFLGLVPGLAIASALSTMRMANGFPHRVEPVVAELARQVQTVSPWRAACHLVPRDGPGLPAAERCVGGNGSRYTAILWGDSHASHYAPALNVLGKARGFAFRQITKSGCPPLVDVSFVSEAPVFRGDCRTFNNNLFQMLRDNPQITDVWIAAFWHANVERLNGESAALAAALAETVRALENMGRSVHIFGVIPHFPFPADGCVVRKARFPSLGINCDIGSEASREFYQLDKLLGRAAGATYIPQLKQFCPDDSKCSPMVGNRAAFSDGHHINAEFAETLAEQMLDRLECRRIGAPGDCGATSARAPSPIRP